MVPGDKSSALIVKTDCSDKMAVFLLFYEYVKIHKLNETGLNAQNVVAPLHRRKSPACEILRRWHFLRQGNAQADVAVVAKLHREALGLKRA